jgi:hypothetical protein
MKPDQTHATAPVDKEKPSRAELLAEVDRIRAMTPPRKAGVSYPTAEELIREERDTR